MWRRLLFVTAVISSVAYANLEQRDGLIFQTGTNTTSELKLADLSTGEMADVEQAFDTIKITNGQPEEAVTGGFVPLLETYRILDGEEGRNQVDLIIQEMYPMIEQSAMAQVNFVADDTESINTAERAEQFFRERYLPLLQQHVLDLCDTCPEGDFDEAEGELEVNHVNELDFLLYRVALFELMEKDAQSMLYFEAFRESLYESARTRLLSGSGICYGMSPVGKVHIDHAMTPCEVLDHLFDGLLVGVACPAPSLAGLMKSAGVRILIDNESQITDPEAARIFLQHESFGWLVNDKSSIVQQHRQRITDKGRVKRMAKRYEERVISGYDRTFFDEIE